MNKKHDTKQLLLFKDIYGKKVEANFDGGEVTSDAGVLFLREVERRIISRIAEVLHDRRHSSYVKHQLIELLKQRVFQIACGYEDGNDSDELRNDPVLKMACERLPESDDPLASQPTMSRFEVYEFCEEYGIKYVLGFKAYNPLQEKGEALVEEARTRYAQEKQPVKVFGEVFYQAKSWPEAAEDYHQGQL